MGPSLLVALLLSTIAATGEPSDLVQVTELYWAGELDQAVTQVEAFLEQHPDHVEAIAWKGSILGSMAADAETTGDAARYGLAAVAELRKALRMDPDCAVALLGMGYVKLKTPEVYGGDLDAAVRHFLAAMDRSEEASLTCAAQVGLAQTFLARKQRERAVLELEAVLAVDPDYEPAQELLASLRSYRPDARIEAIALLGNEHIRREFVLRGLSFEVGDVLDLDELDASEARWRQSGYFSQFDVSVRPIHSDEHVVVDIHVVESAAWEWGAWPARLKRTDLFGRQHYLGGEFYLDKEWETEAIEHPYLWGFVEYGIAAHPEVGVALGTQTGYRFFPHVTRRGDPDAAELISSYALHTGWVEIGVSYAMAGWATVGIRDRLNVFHVADLQQGDGDPYFFPDDITYPDNHVTTFLDLHWPLPRRRPIADLEIGLEQTLGETSLGAKHDFSQTRVSLVNRWHLAPKLGLVLRLAGGTSFGSIPHWQQFVVGGDLGLRGYTVFDHVGTRMLLATVELRIDALTLLNGNMVWQLVPLFDIGDAWAADEAFSLDLTRYPLDYGLGLNLYTAPGRSFRVGMHATFNRENQFSFIVALFPPI